MPSMQGSKESWQGRDQALCAYTFSRGHRPLSEENRGLRVTPRTSYRCLLSKPGLAHELRNPRVEGVTILRELQGVRDLRGVVNDRRRRGPSVSDDVRRRSHQAPRTPTVPPVNDPAAVVARRRALRVPPGVESETPLVYLSPIRGFLQTAAIVEVMRRSRRQIDVNARSHIRHSTVVASTRLRGWSHPVAAFNSGVPRNL